jgi:hypothetical protein
MIKNGRTVLGQQRSKSSRKREKEEWDEEGEVKIHWQQ